MYVCYELITLVCVCVCTTAAHECVTVLVTYEQYSK